MNKPVRIETIMAMAKPLLRLKNADFESLQNLLDQVCSQVADRFTLYSSNGKPRKATIIDIISKSSCPTCITKKLSKTTRDHVDALYKECHMLAVNVLVEELYNFLKAMGYNVRISTEAKLEYGKADIVITITRYGVNLKCFGNKLMVEVKTGKSLSLSQLFRYLLQDSHSAIVVWRIRNRQVLFFKAEEIEALLMEFVRMICLRASRLLSSPTPAACQHLHYHSYQPSQEELQEMFQDFAGAIMETLPYVLETVAEKLGVHSSEA